MAAKKTTPRKTASKRASSARKPKAAAVRQRKRVASLRRAAAVAAGDRPEGVGAATIIYIHGIGNKPPASVLKQQWDQALFEFDLGERSRMAYWVDRERYPVPSEAVSSGGDYADATEEAPQGEFTPKATRAQWDSKGEIASANEEINDIVGSTNEDLPTKTDTNRLRRLDRDDAR